MRDPAELRLKLRAAGFSPLPIIGKRPPMKGWDQLIDADPVEINSWSQFYPAATNTGVFTRRVPTFDSDILDPEAGAAIEELIHDRFDDRGCVLPRIGLAPKRAFPFRTDDPFPKITANVISGGGREEKIELLCDGQQFVVDGIHPDTRQPYQWPKGDLIQFAREDLPYIHAAEARQLVDDVVVQILERFGYRLKTAATRGDGAEGAEGVGWIPNLIDHDELAAYAMKLLKSGMGDGSVVNFLREGVRSLQGVDEERRQRRRDEIPGMVRSARWKLDQEAEERGRQEAPNDAPPIGEDDKPLPKLVPIHFVKGEVLPSRDWIAYDGWIPTRKVTLIQGDGGEGKTPLVHQLQSSCAAALPWLGLRVKECASVGFYTEDEEQDLKERQAAIDAAYGCACDEIGNMHLFPRIGEENELVVFDRARRPVLTKFYQQICEAAFDLHARLVVLDVAVDLFGGNEIARQEVRAFFRPLIGLARKIDGAVVLTSHVSQAGIRSDGGHSGSTDWSNAARTRLYLNRPKAEDGDDADTNARILTRKKANFATIGDTIKLHWDNGLIVPDRLSMPSYSRRSADDVFLALLEAVTKEGQKVSPKPKAGNYAPAFFMKRGPKEREDYRRADFERSMQGLFQRQLIKIVPYGAPSGGYEKLVRIDGGEGLS